MHIPVWSEWNFFPSRAKKTSPLHFLESPHGCDHPSPPLQCWVLWRSFLKREWNDFFATGNLSPCQLSWQPTLHCLGVRGSSVAKAEGTFFSLGTDSDATMMHCCLLTCTQNYDSENETCMHLFCLHASPPGVPPRTAGPAGATHLRGQGRP